jgi:opacity protein-like surface antigen
VKKMILALAVVAALAPAASASAADTLRMSGPSVTLANLFGNSGGGITFNGQQIQGVQPAGSARYREDDADGNGKIDNGERNELKLTAADVNAPAGSLVGGILIDLGAKGFPVVGADIAQLNGQSLQYEVKSQDGDSVPDLTSCGSVILAIPFAGLDLVAASLTPNGDLAELFNPAPNCA